MADIKDTNPKDAVGIAKVPRSTLSAQVIGEMGLAMMEGALKYGRHNYREVGVRASVYYDAVGRHLDAWWEGQDIDPDSGLSHVTKAMAGLMVLRDCMLNENWVDDRPPAVKNQNWVADLNSKAKALLEKYPNPKPAFINQVKTFVGKLVGVETAPGLVSVPPPQPAPGLTLLASPPSSPSSITEQNEPNYPDEIPF